MNDAPALWLAEPPRWAQQLATQPQFDPAVEHVVAVAEGLDAIYNRHGT